MKNILLLIICVSSSLCIPLSKHGKHQATCGYESCHPTKDGFLNVHIVPHTHDDVGWLKTVDQYFYGANNSIQNAGVQYILDTVLQSLRKDPNRRFIYVETAFFWKWWTQQHDREKSLFRRFVNNGQLEFISGGWSMNDEAATNYQSIIDQMTWGLRKLNDTFGDCGRPKMGWQIDPFGHSREMASIFAQLGFDGILLGRIDYQDKDLRFKTKTPEMLWRSSQNFGNSSNIFTGVMFNTYSPPPNFCFDILCDDEPIIDDKKSPLYNVDRMVDAFLEYVDKAKKYYASNNIIITMGNDFNYQDAEVWFKNLDKLIFYTNQRQQNGSKYNLIYSTPSCYVKAIHDEAKGKMKWMVKEDDFFPYASDSHSFWTGYFTSRPTFKRFEREGNNFLQVCKQLYALTDLDPIDRVDLNPLREAMGAAQHHDAITGTAKQHVANDYSRLMSEAISECEYITATALSKIVAPNLCLKGQDEPAPAIPFVHCPLTNVSQCGPSESQDKFIVTVYNPLSRPVTKYVRLPVWGTAYTVKDSQGKELTTQMQHIHENVLTIPGRVSNATVELIFQAKNLPPLGFESFYIEKKTGNDILQPSGCNSIKDLPLKFDENTGLLSQMSFGEVTSNVTQKFLYYKSNVGTNLNANRSSGAYIFRPNGTAIDVSLNVTNKVYKGPLVTEIHQYFNDWISQVVRVYPDEMFAEFNWLVGPIPIDDNIGKEVITRFSSDLNSNSIFYTDSNGREMLKRIRSFRPTWTLKLEEFESGNYYPVTSRVVLKDEAQKKEFAVLVDRAQGGSSLKDGEVDLMVHRRCLVDDAFGVAEALNETAFGKGLAVRGSHYVVLGPSTPSSTSGKTIAAMQRELAQRKLLDTWVFFSPTNGSSFDEYKRKFRMQYNGLQRALPDNVHILTLEPWKGFTFLLRLEHLLEKNEDPNLSKPAVVDLKGLFEPFEIETLEETTLGANQWIKDNHRLVFEEGESIENLVNEQYGNMTETEKENRRRWNNDQSVFCNHVRRSVIDIDDDLDDLKVSLTPMQIRTFIISFKKKFNL